MKHIRDFVKHSRTDYNLDVLSLETTDSDPFIQFENWMKLAVEQGINEPNAMNLATLKSNGTLASRIVLLRNFDHEGFVFYTNYESNKGIELITNPVCALNFYWPELHKQIRLEGKVSKVAESESDEYFNSRPRESQIGAVVSKQSRELVSRVDLEEKYQNLTKKFVNNTVERPTWWGGFRVSPDFFEFWQGRPNRLHDRIAYQLMDNKAWSRSLLYP